MSHRSAPCLLSVGLSVPSDGPDGSFVHAESARRALELMKLLRFDMVVLSAGASDLSIPQFVRQMRMISPWQKWVLAGPGIESSDELSARCNGALAVIDELGDWSELCALASSVARRDRRLVAVEA